MTSGTRAATWLLVACLGVPFGAADGRAQEAGTPTPPTSGSQEPPAPASTSGTAADDEDDMVFNPAQPDYTVINLPTTVRLPRHKLAFRVTHRFTRPLGAGDFGDLVADLFGFDSGARIGLELRFGLARGWQAGVYRTSDRTIQLFTQYGVVRQRDGRPVGVDAWVGFEGTNNFSGEDVTQPGGEGVRSLSLAAVVSHEFGRRGALYVMPAWIVNANPLPGELAEDDDTVLLGLGARVRVCPTVYLVGEIVPRFAGYDPDVTLATFGIEKRVGGHSFQLNFSNGIGTTMAQVARGGLARDQWFIGFGISRKFY